MPTRIVAGRYKRRILSVPRGKETRPTLACLRESLFSSLGGSFGAGHVVVCDLFAGSGAIGLEALSRGASRAVFVERDPEALRCLVLNIATLGVERVTEVVREDVFSFLESAVRTGRTFDIVFADPRYGSHDARRLLEQLDRSPGVAPLVCIEHRSESLPGGDVKNGRRIRMLKAGEKRISIYRFGGDS
jgi:16S rRNA (guanine966-N2)-methyltransferase